MPISSARVLALIEEADELDYAQSALRGAIADFYSAASVAKGDGAVLTQLILTLVSRVAALPRPSRITSAVEAEHFKVRARHNERERDRQRRRRAGGPKGVASPSLRERESVPAPAPAREGAPAPAHESVPAPVLTPYAAPEGLSPEQAEEVEWLNAKASGAFSVSELSQMFPSKYIKFRA
jgi:hypothetical protein